MANEPDSRPWERLEQIAATADSAQIDEFLRSLPAGEAVRAISRLSEENQNKTLMALLPAHAAELLQECPEPQAAELIEQLPPQSAAAIMAEMASQEKAGLITNISAQDAEAILQEMGAEEANEARALASYPRDEAGGLMITEFLAYRETAVAGHVLDDLRNNSERYARYDVQYVYCLSPFGELVGVLRMRDLLLTPHSRMLCDFMIRKPLAVHLHTTIEELADLFARRDFFGVPVVDEGGRLVGVVTRGDLDAAISSRAQSDYLKSHGIVAEELRSMPLGPRVTRRLWWLSSNIVLNIMSAAVIAFYQGTLSRAIALAVFLPIISDMSGNAGIQAIAVSLREMSLGLLKPREMMWVFMKEASLGVINGIVLGIMVALVAVLWKGNGYLGLVVGVALAINTVLAGVVGGVLPLLLKRMKFDPALASGPILTTVTDMCGFFFVLSFASAMLDKL